MKSKAFTIVLIVVNVFIWTYFITRLFINKDEELRNEKEVEVNKKESKMRYFENYQLAENYADPFFKSRKTSPSVFTEHSSWRPKSENKKDKSTVPAVEVIKPEVRYVGLIKNVTNDFEGIFVFVNNEPYHIRAGEVVQGCKFSNYNSDSVLVNWSKNNWYVKAK